MNELSLLEELWRLDPEGGWHVHGPPGDGFVVHDGNGERDHRGPTVEDALRSALSAVRAAAGVE